MGSTYGLGAYGGPPSRSDPGPGDDEEEEEQPSITETEQTMWYHICDGVAIVGFRVGLIFTLLGLFIVVISEPKQWTMFVPGFVMFVASFVPRVIAVLIKKR